MDEQKIREALDAVGVGSVDGLWFQDKIIAALKAYDDGVNLEVQRISERSDSHLKQMERAVSALSQWHARHMAHHDEREGNAEGCGQPDETPGPNISPCGRCGTPVEVAHGDAVLCDRCYIAKAAKGPDINDPSTWPEVKPEDVRIGDAVYNERNHLAGYVGIDGLDADGDATAVCLEGVYAPYRAGYVTFRRPPLEVGQAVRHKTGPVGRIRQRVGGDVYALSGVFAHFDSSELTPLEIAPSLDPRRKGD